MPKPAAKKSRSIKKVIPLEFSTTLNQLKNKYPEAHCALHFDNPFQLLIATILSAQCTDERVNKVTPMLFSKFPNAESMSRADLPQLEDLIRSTGFYKNKAKNIKKCCEEIKMKHNGSVPRTMEDLNALAGVGRKTANVVLGNAFNIASGVVVDTHVTRLSNRFGWVRESGAEKIESKLNRICPQNDWIMLSHYLISHGRSVCTARSPKCRTCFLAEACPKVGV